MDTMNDFEKIKIAEENLKEGDTGDTGDSWDSFVWIFYSSEFDPEGFVQTAERIGISPKDFKDELLAQSSKARAFYYGNTFYYGSA